MFLTFAAIWGPIAWGSVLPAQPPRHPGASARSAWVRPSQSFEEQAADWLEHAEVSDKESLEKILKASSRTERSRAASYAAICEKIYKESSPAPFNRLRAAAKSYADQTEKKKNSNQAYVDLAFAFSDAIASHPKSTADLKLGAKRYAEKWAQHLKIKDPDAKEKSLITLQSHYASLQKQHHEAYQDPPKGTPAIKNDTKPILDVLSAIQQSSTQAGRPPSICQADAQQPQSMQSTDPCDTSHQKASGTVQGWDSQKNDLQPLKAWLKDVPGLGKEPLKLTPLQVQNAQFNLGIFKLEAPKGNMILKAERAKNGECRSIEKHLSISESGFRQGPCDKYRKIVSRSAPFIPRLHAWARGEDPKEGLVCFSLMDEAEGKPLSLILQRSSPSERQKWMQDFGKTVAKLHFKTKGPEGRFHVHGDLHWDNVVLEPKSKKWTLIDVGAMTALSAPIIENKTVKHASILYDLNQAINPKLEFRGALLQAPIERFLHDEPDLTRRRENLQKLLFDPDGAKVESEDYLTRARSSYARFNSFLHGYLGEMSRSDRQIVTPVLKGMCEGPFEHLRSELQALSIPFENAWKKNPYFFLSQKRFPEIEECFKILNSYQRRL